MAQHAVSPAALAAIALPGLWRSRKEPVARLLLAAFGALTALTAEDLE